MKIKSIISLSCLAAGLLLFQACDDVPAPYHHHKGESDIYGDGSKDNPYSVKGASLNQNGGKAFVKAFVVGYIPTGDDVSSTISDAVFGADGAGNTNLVVADAPDTKDINGCMAVQLPSGVVRIGLNLQDNPDILGREVIFYGTMENYFGGPGVKNVTGAIVGGAVIGDIPDGSESPGNALFSQDFSSSLGEFTSVSAEGELSWKNDYQSAMVTGYDDFDGTNSKYNKPGVTYLVGPEIDLSQATEAHVAVNMAINYEQGDINANNSLLVCKDYTGDVNTTAWTQLTYDTDGLNGGFDFKSKEVDIPAEIMGGKMRIALKHTCNSEYSSTWEVKSIEVFEGKADTTATTPGGEGKATVSVEGTAVTLTDPDATTFGTVTTIDLNTFGWANADSVLTEITDSEGTKITFAKEGGTNPPAFYSATQGVRVYANNSITLAASKPIAKVVLNCDSYNGTDYVGNTELYADIDGNTWKVVNAYTGTGGGTQLRVKTIEITYAEGNGGGDQPTPPTPGGEGKASVSVSGTAVTLTDPDATTFGTVTTTDLNTFGWANATEPTEITDSEGTTITFAKEGGTNPPKFYTGTKGVRMYALNSMTLAASKPIAKVVLNCDFYEGTAQVGNPQLYANIDGNTWKVVNDWTSNSKGTQLRIKTIEITYAEGENNGGGDEPNQPEEPGGAILSETFASSMGSFTTQDVAGEQEWNQDSQYGCVKMSAFDNATSVSLENEDWLISPAIDLSKERTLTFEQALGPAGKNMDNVSELYTVWVSNDYSNDVKTATWKPVTINYPETSGWTFSSVEAPLPAVGAQARLAFKYKNADGDETLTWEIKNVTVK